jgi:hypothetical protein
MKKLLFTLLITVAFLMSADKVVYDGNTRDTQGQPVPVLASDNGDGTFNMGAKLSENALDVHMREIHTNAVNQEFHFSTATQTNFASPVTSQDRTFTVVDATGFSVGDKIEIIDGTTEPQFPTILAISVNDITINRPIDRNYTTSDSIRKVLVNMAVDGSVTPQVFRITGEQATVVTHITRVIFEMTHNTAGDLGLFGNQAALTNGVVVRVFKGVPGVWKTITVWKTNADIKRDMYDVQFDSRSGGGGTYGTSGRVTFTRLGMVGEYNPDEGDFLEIMIQDDLTGLVTFQMNAQGHTED